MNKQATEQITKQKRPTLLDLKNALNKIPEETLGITSIALDYGITDQPNGDFQIIWMIAEDEYNKEATQAMKNIKKGGLALEKFVDKLNQDLTQAKLREGELGYDEEYNNEGDW